MARKQQMLNDSSKTIGGAALLVVLLIVSAVLSSVYSNEESSGPVHSVQAGAGMVAAPLQFVGVGVAYAEDAAGYLDKKEAHFKNIAKINKARRR